MHVILSSGCVPYNGSEIRAHYTKTTAGTTAGSAPSDSTEA
jgi:hypothetical protein